MQRNLTPCLAGLSATLWSLAAVMIATQSYEFVLLGVIGLSASISAITGIALVYRITDEERQKLFNEGRQEGYREGVIDNAQALMNGANVSIMPPPRTPRGSTCADRRCGAHDPRA